jgi:predicted amidohydrolase YtcJ
VLTELKNNPDAAPSVVLRNAQVYAGAAYEGEGEWPSAIAVTGPVITAVGGDAEVLDTAGPRTTVVDLGGQLVLPGFIDAHVHPIVGGSELLECALAGLATRQEYLAAIASYAAGLPEGGWVTGGGWSMPAFERGLPDATSLDAVTGAHPTLLVNRDRHSAWVNSVALQAAGIDKSTPDPAGGRIERDAEGRPSGALHEAAIDLVTRVLPPPVPNHGLESLRAGQAYLNRLGITGWQDAKVEGYRDDIGSYLSLQEEGALTARVVGAFWLDPQRDVDQVEEIIELRRSVPPGHFELSSVKIMLDGVCETHTAALSSPYLDGHGHETDNTGLRFFDPDLLRQCARRLDDAGFQLHFHAVGDAAVTEALDTVASVRTTNGPLRRPHVAHVQVVHPDDVHRFRSLGVCVNAQPLWARWEPQMTELTVPFLGEDRVEWQYPFGELESAGASLVIGSDWPVSTPDPIRLLHVAVNRTPVPDGSSWPPERSVFLPDQRISLPAAVRAYTQGSAWINHHENVSGTIDVGKSADLAVLDGNFFDRPRHEIWRSRVTQTWFAGTCVHGGER